MTFEELSIGADVAKLTAEHPFYKFERITLDLLKEGRDHPEEHTAMLKLWGLPTEENDKYGGNLTVLNGIKNRSWHILLHYKYWNDAKINTNLVEELLNEHPEINLDNIPLPSVKGE